MKIMFDRRKLVYEKWQADNYENHIKRLQSLMQKNNYIRLKKMKQQKSIQNLINTSHKSHKISQEYKQQSEKKVIKQQSVRLHKYLKSLQLPKIDYKIQKKNFRIHRNKSLDHKKYRENNLLYQKIQNASSYYQKKLFDQRYTQLCEIKQNIRRRAFNSKSNVRLQTIYKQSHYLQMVFPEYTYTHIQNYQIRKKNKYDQIYIKFDRVPFHLVNQQIHYSIEINNIKMPKPTLVSFNQLLKDMFLLKIPSSKIKKNNMIKIQIWRYSNNDENIIGYFQIYSGENKVTQLYQGKSKQNIGQFLCFTSWRKVIKMKKNILDENQRSPGQHQYQYSQNEYNQQVKNDFNLLNKRKISIQKSLQQPCSRLQSTILGFQKNSQSDTLGEYLFD